MINARVRVSRTKDVGGKTRRGVRTGLHRAASKGFTVSQEEVSRVSGFLGQSGFPPQWRGDTLEWGYEAEYARFVEEGTAPHWPPIEPLKYWAQKVFGDEDAAYAVQATIAKHGTQPHPYVEPGFQAMVDELNKRGLAQHVDAELSR